MSAKILKEGKKYTFSDYFEIGNPTEEIVAELGYCYSAEPWDFPREKNFDKGVLGNIVDLYYALLPKVSLNSEVAKREVMIAPLLHAVVKVSDVKLNIEYPVEIDDRLGGNIDYLFRASQALIVIEAKRGDLDRGFNQLAAEMIAMDIYDEGSESGAIYGAITIGQVWGFAVLERQRKAIIRDAHTFRFPEDIVDIFSIIKGILG
uniref:Type I restriction enzyme R protein N terminus (HSDR_N) n=1 Tax=Candidatus Kentrum sp. MB TaxID=2138164 RepID=A0A451BCS2_9GAMM|nr:MAG: hypothetical protein BECKMB1821G_GA0114241_104110 [Candidatus Kentron sp. MB]VFK33289.1 MAG: hypothetical protein BECKMB1821I_GA0114274_104312 [Candidatus Kentron sp. MB]VFK76084.1 MAG: hypothetical protein BECKMB1821H_GA0114242_104112 [Candidatus Kentron sp. MB]